MHYYLSNVNFNFFFSFPHPQQYVKNLASRAVAYLNVDIAVQGSFWNTQKTTRVYITAVFQFFYNPYKCLLNLLGNYSLRSLGTPLLNSVIYDSTKKIPNPDDQDTVKKTVYDKWLATFPNTDKTLPRYMYI